MTTRARGAILVAAIVLLSIGLWRITAGFTLHHLNSDLLFIECVYRDAFVDHQPLLHWNLPRLVGVFPDLLLYLPLRALGGEVGRALLLYAAAALALLLAGAAAVVGELRLSPKPARALPLLAAAGLLVAGLQQAPSPLPVCLWPYYHGGVLLAGLPLLALSWRAIREGWTAPRAAGWLLLVAPILFCDLYVVPQILGPLFLSAWLTRRSDGESRRLAFAGALLAIAILVDLMALALLGRLGFGFGMNPALAAAEKLLSPLGILATVAALSAVAGVVALLWRLPRAVRIGLAIFAVLSAVAAFVYLSSNGLLPPRWPADNLANLVRAAGPLSDGAILLWVGAAAGLGVAVAALLRKRNQARPLALFVLSSSGSALLCAAVGWAHLSDARYLAPLYVLPILLGAPIAAALVPPAARRWFDFACLGALALSAALILRRPPALEAWPDEVRCLDRWHAQLGLHHGYSGYWTAKYAHALSHTPGMLLNPMRSGDVTLDPIITNRAWFLGDGGRYPRYDFAIVVGDRRPDEGVGPFDSLVGPVLEDRFGAPASVQRCGAWDLWIYDRPGDVGFRNRLRLPSLRVEGRDPPSHVAAPASLNDLRSDGTAVTASGVVAIAPGAEVAVRLDPPVEANVLELSLGAGENVDVVLDQATLSVAAIPGEGLRARYLPLPGMRRIDHLTLRNRGPAAAHVGHLFLYGDDAPGPV